MVQRPKWHLQKQQHKYIGVRIRGCTRQGPTWSTASQPHEMSLRGFEIMPEGGGPFFCLTWASVDGCTRYRVRSGRKHPPWVRQAVDPLARESLGGEGALKGLCRGNCRSSFCRAIKRWSAVVAATKGLAGAGGSANCCFGWKVQVAVLGGRHIRGICPFPPRMYWERGGGGGRNPTICVPNRPNQSYLRTMSFFPPQ